MVWLSYIALILVTVLLIVLHGNSIDESLIKFTLVWSLILLIPFYFISRSKKEPDKTELLVAKFWLYFRRFISCIAILFFCLVTYISIEDIYSNGFSWKRLCFAFFGLLMAFGAAFFGWYGKKRRFSSFKEDRIFYETKKKRYDWK